MTRRTGVIKNTLTGIRKKNPRYERAGRTDKLFNAATRRASGTTLMTAMREQEVMHTYWSDVNLSAATVRVSHKLDSGWTPKAYKEREIPIPSKLEKSLKVWKAKSRRDLQPRVPHRGVQSEAGLPRTARKRLPSGKAGRRQLRLHKFRATFNAVKPLAGVDSGTAARGVGHSDMEIHDALSEAVTQSAGEGES